MKQSIAALLSSVILIISSSVPAATPEGWFAAGSRPTDFEFGTDSRAPYDGAVCAVIRSKAASSGFGTLMQTFAADNYRGSRIRLSGYLRTEAATRAQMWLRIDGSTGEVLGFDNMDSRPVIGSSEWTRYEIALKVPPESANIAFGVLLAGEGVVWADAFDIEEVDDGIPLTSGHAGIHKAPRNLSFE